MKIKKVHFVTPLSKSTHGLRKKRFMENLRKCIFIFKISSVFLKPKPVANFYIVSSTVCRLKLTFNHILSYVYCMQVKAHIQSIDRSWAFIFHCLLSVWLGLHSLVRDILNVLLQDLPLRREHSNEQ